MLFVKVVVNVLRKEDFFDLVFFIIIIFIYGICCVSGNGNDLNLFLYFLIIYKII